MKSYGQTSRFTGSGFQRWETVRSEYRLAADARQRTFDRLCELYAAGRDVTEARRVAEAAERRFWFLDHHARRYRRFTS